MADQPENTTSVDLTDSLSVVTRRERRNLLVAASMAILMSWARLVPTEIQGLGIRFTGPQQSAILWSAVFAVAYFLIAFAVYGLRDRMAWRLQRDRALQFWVERHARINAIDPPGSRQRVLLTEVNLVPGGLEMSGAQAAANEAPPPLERRLFDIEQAFRESTRSFRVIARRWTYARDFVDLVLPVLFGLGGLFALYRAIRYPQSF